VTSSKRFVDRNILYGKRKRILTRKVLVKILKRIETKNSWGKNELIKMIAEVSCEVLD